MKESKEGGKEGMDGWIDIILVLGLLSHPISDK